MEASLGALSTAVTKRCVHTIVDILIDIVVQYVVQPMWTVHQHVSLDFFCRLTCEANQHFVGIIKESQSTDCSLYMLIGIDIVHRLFRFLCWIYKLGKISNLLNGIRRLVLEINFFSKIVGIKSDTLEHAACVYKVYSMVAYSA